MSDQVTADPGSVCLEHTLDMESANRLFWIYTNSSKSKNQLMSSNLTPIEDTFPKPPFLPFVSTNVKRQLMPGIQTEFTKGWLAFRFLLVKFIPFLSKLNEKGQLCEMEEQEQYCLNKLEFSLWLPCSFCHTLLEMFPVMLIFSVVTSSYEATLTIIILIHIFQRTEQEHSLRSARCIENILKL